jgi:peroxiredoxin Q/BCP
MIRITESAAPGRMPAFVYALRILIALGLCVAAWIVACQRSPSAKAVKEAVPQANGKHTSGKVHFDLLAKLLADDRRSRAPDEWLHELADPKAPFRVATQADPLLQQPAPDFTLSDHRGRRWRLQEQLTHGPVILVFYLSYACDRCVSNLFELNADVERFHYFGGEVIAVSGDAADLTRQRFVEYGAFRFPVLSDPGHAVAQSYGTFRPATRSKPEELLHGTFVIGQDGRVRWVHRGDTPFHSTKALLYEVARSVNRLPEPRWRLVPSKEEPAKS